MQNWKAEGMPICVQYWAALEEEMATHSSILAWEIPRAEEPDGLQFMGITKVFHFFCHENLKHVPELAPCVSDGRESANSL